MRSNVFAKMGAVAYVLWGLLHFKAAQIVWQMAHTLEAGMLQGRLSQLSWDLLFFATFAILVAVKMNWKNSRCGYWLNLVVISAADIGFITFVLLPGYAPMNPGALGPLLWIVAVVLSTIGFMQANRQGE